MKSNSNKSVKLKIRPHLGIDVTTTITMIITTITIASFIPLQLADAFVCRDIIDAPIAASGNNVYTTWATDKPGNWEVMFRASNDTGKTFGDKINLSNSSNANSLKSDVSASDNNVYVSFKDDKNGNTDTYVRVSNDNGKTFSSAIKINGTGNQPQKMDVIPLSFENNLTESEENTLVKSSGNNVYVVSWDKKSGNWEVFLSKSIDNGKTFENTINLSNTPDKRSDRAWITTDGNNVYVTWWETSSDGKREPVFVASNDGGKTFGPVLNLGIDGPINNGDMSSSGSVG